VKRSLFFLLIALPVISSAGLKPGDFVTSGPAHEKKIALTFDDGPGPNTEKFLELLKKYNAKATFFMLGDQARIRPDVAKHVAADGHEIANHTMTHMDYNKRYKYRLKENGGDKDKATVKVKQDLLIDMKGSRAIIEKIIGQQMKLLRMPHGIDRPWIKDVARQAGFILVNWTYGADWSSPPPNPTESLKKSYVKAMRPGCIYLIHDGWPKSDKSLAVTEAILIAAKEKGYTVVPVGELLGLQTRP
jgi:peptidoglycan/xylan/chitin deacetylase (PgdA/CDA1 family)